ncbi:hypothetical protein CMV_023117 [Castanea mollissima]|uniref:Uncharacterized protein n=1 Tax=Castanea mollissima TaxID=60419 RepID=A0A8J4VJ37_9ROSI|nr:hypothetical protein CMV_023117 [Castanea mollissima]
MVEQLGDEDPIPAMDRVIYQLMDTIIKLQQMRPVYNLPTGPVWNPRIMKSTNARTIPHTPTNTFSKNRFSRHHTLLSWHCSVILQTFRGQLRLASIRIRIQ